MTCGLRVELLVDAKVYINMNNIEDRILALTKVTEGIRTLGTGEVTTANMAVDPTNASNLSSGSVPLAQLGNAPSTDTTVIEDDIALVRFQGCCKWIFWEI